MKTLDLCVIADRFCPTSRTYLTYLKANGYKVRKILLVDFTGPHEPSRAMARRWGRLIASIRKQRVRLPERDYPAEFQALCERVQANLPVKVNYFGSFDFSAHADRVEGFVAEDYDDPDLHRRLAREGRATFLYTNGGRVPAAVLDRADQRILHIHPGVVPEVKGSDCLFWSLLTRGRPGMSCFYMNAGIDTGDIILTREFEAPRLPALAETFASDPDLAYRALLHAYDPHLRAMTLLDVVAAAGDTPLDRLASVRQQPEAGRAFFWMHPRLVSHVLARISEGVPA
jgi:hypothetical protein